MEQLSSPKPPLLRPPAWRLPVGVGVLAVLAFLSVRALDRFPVPVVVFRSDGDVFKVSFFLNSREPVVESAGLTPAQRREAVRATLSRDGLALGSLSRVLGGNGRYAAAPGDRSSGEWPWYFGWSWNGLKKSRGNGGWFDSFSFPERVSLLLLTRSPPGAPWARPEIVTLPSDPSTSAALDPVRDFPPPVVRGTPETALRVEILNGCGMTNAADAVARAARDAGMEVVFVGNASRWDYPETTVETSVGMPVALEEIVSRMGLSEKAVREAARPKPGVDVVFIVGRDYRQIRERLRD